LQTKVGRVIQTSVCVRLENKAASIKARRLEMDKKIEIIRRALFSLRDMSDTLIREGFDGSINLLEYCKFCSNTKIYLEKYWRNDKIISEQLRKFPEIEYTRYKQSESLELFLTYFEKFRIFLWPIYRKRERKEKELKEKARQVSSLCSSIIFRFDNSFLF
jgi:hypothetical protein